MVSVATPAPNEHLPVVVERLDTPSGRSVLREREDAIQVRDEGVVEFAHGHVAATGCLLEHRPERVGERELVWRLERLAQLLDGLVGTSELAVAQVEQVPQLGLLVVGEPVPWPKDEPSSPAPDASHLRPGAEEELATQLRDGLARSLHQVEGVVGVGDVREGRVLADGLLERVVHVGREEDDLRLLLRGKRGQPLLHGVGTSKSCGPVFDEERGFEERASATFHPHGFVGRATKRRVRHAAGLRNSCGAH